MNANSPVLLPLTDDDLSESLRCYLLSIAEQSLEPDLRPKVGASDLVQQTLLQAHRARDSFRGSTSEEYRGWLRGILLHVLLNFRRSVRDTDARCLDREVSLEHAQNVPAHDESPSKLVGRDEQQERLRQATALLSAEYQQVLALRFEEDCSFAEIGQRMGSRSEDAARMLLARATEKLRELLQTPDG